MQSINMKSILMKSILMETQMPEWSWLFKSWVTVAEHSCEQEFNAIFTEHQKEMIYCNLQTQEPVYCRFMQPQNREVREVSPSVYVSVLLKKINMNLT